MESIMVLAKVVLPHIFEKMSMQDLRTLIAERSIMNIYSSGESFELLPQYVGFLLEGFVRMQGGLEEMLTAPAAILPRLDSFHSESLVGTTGSFYHQVPVYQVETRARVVIFDIAGFEAGRSLQKRPSSLISPSADRHSGSLGREHSSLMSWPEHLFKSNQRDGEVSGHQQSNMSARAMELSIYGSMSGKMIGGESEMKGKAVELGLELKLGMKGGKDSVLPK